MKVKYICIDDQPDGIKHLIDSIQLKSENLDIEVIEPDKFDNLQTQLESSAMDGIILDWRINEGKNAQDIKYSSSTIAQQIRAKATENLIADIPIILISLDEKQIETFKQDLSAHDLFDAYFLKHNITDSETTEYNKISKLNLCNFLISLATGYQFIYEATNDRCDSIIKILHRTDDFPLDKSALVLFDECKHKKPVHVYARFILKDIIAPTGYLIDEGTLAARLGVDRKNSASWNKIMSHFQFAKYKGPFSDYYTRFWFDQVSDWINDNMSKESLGILSAQERVTLLIKALKLDEKELTAAKPYKEAYSSYFWHVCQITGAPIDGDDGIMIASRNRFPWQEKQYIAREVALQKQHEVLDIQIHPNDIEYLNELLEQS